MDRISDRQAERYGAKHAQPSYLAQHFSLQMQRPPTSTLFPYTTLFRSHTSQNFSNVLAAGFTINSEQSSKVLAALELLDRKSTRLNSSHSQISYAVFCLKQKTCSSRSASPARERTPAARSFSTARLMRWTAYPTARRSAMAQSTRNLLTLRSIFLYRCSDPRHLHSFPTRRSSDLIPRKISVMFWRQDSPSIQSRVPRSWRRLNY